jgi:hypothetical protein
MASQCSWPRFAVLAAEEFRHTARVLRLAVTLAALLAPIAHAQVQQLGDGRDGALLVTSPGTIINTSTALSEDAAAGDPLVTVVDSSAFTTGSLVLILQSQWRSGGERYRIGEYSVHVVERVVGARLELNSPLNRPWKAGETQAVLVPQYTTVTVAEGGSLVAAPWNGTSGGVMALSANGAVRVDGVLSASGAGFRGGTPREVDEREVGCAREDEAAPRGAERGESVLIGGFGTAFTGRGNNDSGGGGALCQYAGGGGGASLGEGGQGGFSYDGKRDVGGVGGAPLTFAGLVIGSGGGATNGTFGRGQPGARGGGAVFLRARSLDGTGHVEANGADGSGPDTRFGGASGAGGAGGIVIEVVDSARCALFANGGAGGAGFASGPGGGGGGGFASLRAGKVTQCPMSVAGGAAGLVMGAEQGATPGAAGKTAVREVGAQQTPFMNGPGVTITRLGCGCASSDGLWALLAVASLLRRRR